MKVKTGADMLKFLQSLSEEDLQLPICSWDREASELSTLDEVETCKSPGMNKSEDYIILLWEV